MLSKIYKQYATQSKEQESCIYMSPALHKEHKKGYSSLSLSFYIDVVSILQADSWETKRS